MNNKFIKTLIIINGILIPIFVIILLTDYIKTKINRDDFDSSDIEYSSQEKKLPELKETIRYSSIQKIPNSEYFIVAKYLVLDDKPSYGDYDLIIPYTVPDRTINILFLDKNYNVVRKLLEKDCSIKKMFISKAYLNKDKTQEDLKFLSFYIAKEDTTGEGKINDYDQHYIYVSDLNGENLTKVTDREINQYQWISEGTELLLQFEEKDNNGNENLRYGIYNIQKKSMTIPKSID